METAKPAHDNEHEPRKPPRVISGRDELNLAEFPLTVLSRHVSRNDKVRVFEDRIRDQGSGELITRRLTVSADETYGLPTPLDDDVIVGLIQITKAANNFTDRTVSFSRYQLIELLGWPYSGQSFRRVDESLNRWLGVTLRYENAWWDKSAQSWVSEGFHMLDNLTLYHQDTIRRMRKAGGQTPLPFSSFSWNKVVFRSFQAENLKRLDLSLYFHLNLAASKRAYRFLDKRFYRCGTLQFDLRDFACEHIGLSRNHTAAKIKEKLQPAIEELEAAGFLEPLDRTERYVNVCRGEWKIILVRKQLEPAKAPRKVEVSTLFKPSELESGLIARGVTPVTAAELVGAYPAEHIEDRIEVFDWLIAKQDKRVTRSPGGYLADSIRKSYARPKGFESKAEREKKRATEQERTRRAEEAKQRTEREQQAREEAEQGRIAAYLETLTADEREAIEAEAIEKAAPFFVQQLRRNTGSPETEARYLKLILDMHVSGILESQGKND
jgi:hypothetical protein